MASKSCKSCGRTKSTADFYAAKSMSDGFENICKECKTARVRQNRLEKLDYYTQYEKTRAMASHRVAARNEYAKTPDGKVAIRRAKDAWQSRNADKRAAHVILGNAVKNGKIKKTPCEVCGSTRLIHGHHADYSRPLDVRWLCPKHHREAHNSETPSGSAQLTLPWPPSVNRYYRQYQGRAIISKEGRKYRNSVVLAIGNLWPRMDGFLQVSLKLYPPDRRRTVPPMHHYVPI